MRKQAVLLAATSLLGFGLASAAPAQAASSAAAYNCPANRLCVWTGPNATGARAVFARGDVNLAKAPGPSGMNNKISSYKNNTGRNWSFHDGVNYNGKTRYAHPYTYGNVGKALDNKTSSIKKR